jgi:hypothetical protein
MLAVMRDPEADPAKRFEAAKSAAPYLDPRLAAVAHSGPEGGAIAIEIADKDRAKALASFVAKMREKPPRPEGQGFRAEIS